MLIVTLFNYLWLPDTPQAAAPSYCCTFALGLTYPGILMDIGYKHLDCLMYK